MIKFTARAIIKWTRLTLFFGAHSFIWGLIVRASGFAMLAGLLTLIMIFSAIESSDIYQNKRATRPLFAKAIDMGIKFRVYLTISIPLSYMALTSGIVQASGYPSGYLPNALEAMICLGAHGLSYLLTGISLMQESHFFKNGPEALGYLQRFIATYFTTIITGLIHTIILAAICGVIYAFLRLSKKPTAE